MGNISPEKRYEVASEFGFRCAICRAPVWEIHHIVEREHGGKDISTNLIPLCPNHHQAYYHREKLINKPKLIELKNNPIGLNDCEGFFVHPLSNQKKVNIGNCDFIDSHPILSYESIPIIDINCGNASGPHLYFYCEDSYGQPAVHIKNGEWLIGKGGYRFESNSTNITIFDDHQVKELIHISLNKDFSIKITGSFYIDKHYIEISSDEFCINGTNVSKMTVNSQPGFCLNKSGRVLF